MQLKKYQAVDLLNRVKFELENVERLIASAGTFKNFIPFAKRMRMPFGYICLKEIIK